MRLEILCDTCVESEISVTPDYLDWNIERFQLMKTLGVDRACFGFLRTDRLARWFLLQHSCWRLFMSASSLSSGCRCVAGCQGDSKSGAGFSAPRAWRERLYMQVMSGAIDTA